MGGCREGEERRVCGDMKGGGGGGRRRCYRIFLSDRMAVESKRGFTEYELAITDLYCVNIVIQAAKSGGRVVKEC